MSFENTTAFHSLPSDDNVKGGTKKIHLESPRTRRSEDIKSNRYKCHECPKTFSRPSSLRIHILSHTGEKPHVCPQPGCGRRFSVQSNMRRHLKVHYCNNHPHQNFIIGKIDTRYV